MVVVPVEAAAVVEAVAEAAEVDAVAGAVPNPAQPLTTL